MNINNFQSSGNHFFFTQIGCDLNFQESIPTKYILMQRCKRAVWIFVGVISMLFVLSKLFLVIWLTFYYMKDILLNLYIYEIFKSK